MKIKGLILTLLFVAMCSILNAQSLTKRESPATITLHQKTLMHEMRATPYPLNGAIVDQRKVSFQWPLPEQLNQVRSGLDGMEERKEKIDKMALRYKLRYGKDSLLQKDVKEVETHYPFYNPDNDLSSGQWYWQYALPSQEGWVWSKVLTFTVKDAVKKFCPPAFSVLQKNIPAHHPRILLDRDDWDKIIERSMGSEDRNLYLKVARKALQEPMKDVSDIRSERAAHLKTEQQRNAMLTRESRRIIDREEANTDALIRAYLLTREKKFAEEALRRVRKMSTWGGNKNVKGDFNDATLLSLCSMAYDALYDLLDAPTKEFLLSQIRTSGERMYRHNINRLENHIADNHVWQMTFRIFTMATFAVYGEIPEAERWADYCYNLWVARFPGLNQDGAWHNGDSYFHVNIRTLIEVPWLYSRLTGYDFFADPWYQGNALYVIYQQPPFSKSGGNGSSHQNIKRPNGPRVSYAEALARLTQNSYLADYVKTIQTKEPNILQMGANGKAGGLAWFRLTCNQPLPQGKGLKDLPLGKVFPQSGLASFSTNLGNTTQSAMLSFRSSPYGSTSHAISNQNAYNTFWNGKPLFYSSGHHTSFVDKHGVYAHRATRAHNSILVDGAVQRIGTEGYGWIPRHYCGEEISYVVGDASNAYGEVISPLWLERARVAHLEFSKENGWHDTTLRFFRRHIVTLGRTGYTLVYDELEAEQPTQWTYLLHTIQNPMEIIQKKHFVLIRATTEDGQSDAYLLSSGKLKTAQTDEFFTPAVNWLKADANGVFKPYPNHWHFKADSRKAKTYRFATLIHTHAKGEKGKAPKRLNAHEIQVGEWLIHVNLDEKEAAGFKVTRLNQEEEVSITYLDKGATIIHEKGCQVSLKDEFPELEI